METKRHILIFGNQDLEFDSLPFRILPRLKQRFPDIKFEIKDPNEELDLSAQFLILDTVDGIAKTTLFSDLESFAPFRPRLTMHDFDLYTHLKYLEKLGKLKKIKIIGLPPTISEIDAIEGVSVILHSNSF